MVITNVQQRGNLTGCSDKKRTTEFVGEIQAMVDTDPNESIRSIAWNMGVLEYLIRHAVHEDI